jgi:hypothetical protein
VATRADGTDDGPTVYRHTQSGARLAVLLVATVAATLLIAVGSVRRAAGRDGGPPAGLWMAAGVGALVAAAAAVSFSRLTITVTQDELRWGFVGPVGRGRVARADVASAAPTTTTLLADGIGIHRAARGWVYNVALGPAVLVTRRDGAVIVLGTDDPAGLLAALAPR